MRFLPNKLERTLVLMFMILDVHGEISGHLSVSSVIACSSVEVGSEADSKMKQIFDCPKNTILWIRL